MDKQKGKFKSHLNNLKNVAYSMDEALLENKIKLLQQLTQSKWSSNKDLLEYHAVLLFIATHSENKKITALVDQSFLRIANYVKALPPKPLQVLQDTALPYTPMITRFSHDFLCWMFEQKEFNIQLDSFVEEGEDLNNLLALTLTSIEKDQTTSGLSNDDLFELLEVKEKEQFRFLINQFKQLDGQPFVKDHLWESMKPYFHILPKQKNNSLAYNRLPGSIPFYQNKLLKKFDHIELIDKTLPAPVIHSTAALNKISSVIKKSLLLTMRETDPSTYMDISSLRHFALERGIDITIYGIKADRQLPLQSYIGYTLFKNGFPVAYGGSWVFGKTAIFGLNVFEAFRGGESGFIMIQLLRVYKQVFQLERIEIEPYQYGLDNPDGIKSGAFWFYYRYGFRPVDKQLKALAEKEYKKITTINNYRSSEATLKRFTESNIEWIFNDHTPILYADVAEAMVKWITQQYKGNRILAKQESLMNLSKHFPLETFPANSQKAMEEWALYAATFKVKSPTKWKLIQQAILLKSENPYLYNQVLTQLLFG